MTDWGGYRPGAGRKPGSPNKPKVEGEPPAKPKPVRKRRAVRERRSQSVASQAVVIPAGHPASSASRLRPLRAGTKVPVVPGKEAVRRDITATAQQFVDSRAIIEGLLEASRQMRSRKAPRTDANNPFRLPQFPTGAIPKDKSKQMALDEFPSLAWANQSWGAGYGYGAAAEGLLFLGYPALAEMSQRPEYRTIAEILATESTRKWIKFSTTAGKMTDGKIDKEVQKSKLERIKELETFLDDIGARARYEEMAMQDGLMGRSHLGHLFSKPGDKAAEQISDIAPAELAMPIGTGRRGDPLTDGKVGKGMKMRLQSVEAMWVYPQQYNATQPLAADFYSPQLWYINGVRIHASRLLTFVGKPVPDILKPAYAFGGLSMTQIAKPYVDIWLNTRESIAAMIQSFSVMILMTDLQTLLQPGGAGLLAERVQIFNELRDNQGLMLANKQSEDLKNVSAPLGGLHELQAQAQEHMFAVSRIPAVKFAGIQPAGLNASSEGEIRVFYDTIKAYQQMFFRPNLTRTIDFAMRCLWGEPDPDIVFEFVDLWESTDKEKGDARKADADAAAVYLDRGVISPEEERARLASDPNGIYQGIDPDDVPEPPAMPGEEGGEGGEGEGGEGGGPDNDNKPKPKAKVANDAAMVAEMGRRVLPFAGDEWVEAQHPRDPDGKFSSGGGGGGGHAADPPAGSKGAQSLEKSTFLQSLTNPVDGLSAHIHNAKGGKFNVDLYDIDTGELAGVAAASTIEEAKEKAKEFLGNWEPAAKAAANPKVSAAIKKTFSNIMLPPSSDMEKISGKKGSNPGGVYKDFDGKEYYIKQPKSKAHVRNELTAAALYNLAGSPTLKYVPVQGGDEVATQMAKLNADNVSELSDGQRASAKKQFAVHAWLANWDAVGTGGDNQGVVTGGSGMPTTLDVGGALNYRAQGEPKGDLFGANVPEFSTMRDPKFSPDNAGLFGDMTTAELTESVEKVTSLSDQEIKDVVEGMGGNADLADKLIARKDDLAKQLGAINPQWEADHPRGPDGRYVKKLGGEEPAPVKAAAKQEEPAIANAYTPEEFKKAYGGIKSPHVKESYYQTVKSVMFGSAPAGSNYRRLLQKLLDDGKSHGLSSADTAVIKDKMIDSLGKTRMNLMADGKHAEADKVLAKMKAFGYESPVAKPLDLSDLDTPPAPKPEPKAAPKKVEIKEEPKPAPAPEPAKDPFAGMPEPTEAELNKAKKSASLQKQYVPGASELMLASHSQIAQNLIDKFNSEWSGKEGLNDQQLKAKVNHFKALSAAVAAVKAEEQKSIEATKAAAAAEQKKKNDAAAAALKAQQQAAKAKTAEYMKALGISETEATGFEALVGMLGIESKDAVSQFQKYEEAAKKLGYPISGFQYALIRNYINGGYGGVNAALRSPNLTPSQHVYARMVNNALDKLPKYTGTVDRGAHLSADQIANYKPGHIVREAAFTSTGIGFKFNGNVSYKIKSIGKRGADFSTGANKNEKEVLFKAGTYFLVHSVVNKGGTTYIEMEEVEHHG